jgi:hypothetical protein
MTMSDNDNTGVFGSISKYAVSKHADTEAYTDLRAVATTNLMQFPTDPYVAAESFKTDCNTGEREFMEVNYANEPDAKHSGGKRAGQWKYRTYLPGSYSSAKTELVKGLEAGLDPTGMGKSALNKARTETTKKDRDVYEKIDDYLGKLNRAINSIDDSNERQIVRSRVMQVLSTQ